ncbi:glycosyltransferase [Legionella sp. km772]|uniref:glycosyltransferase n=1 Tax=Legionella sp. km772 TaxID=2498111 RepID=UPI001F23D04D|nr:glycosyltransferase [Legionella sp. km772]
MQGRLILLNKSPARSYKIRKQLKAKVKDLSLNAVFTLFGPAYVKFSIPHLCGIADGWVTHSNKNAFELLPTIKEKIKVFLLCRYKLWWYQQAEKWCVEAQIAKDGFLTKTKSKPQDITVIANAVNHLFQDYSTQIIERNLTDSIKIFCLGADYWHKNYQIIPSILAHLKNKITKEIIFFVTLPEHSAVFMNLMSLAKEKKVDHLIMNLGPISLEKVIEQYKKCNILFFPSVLETFSITPLEALYMNMPMIISNIPANIEVLKEHAIYVNSLDVNEITEKLMQLISNYSLEVQKLQELKRNNYFKSVSTTQNRFTDYKNILKTMIN